MIDADRFLRKIKNAVFYEIPTDQISPYLVEHFITPILQGRKVLYGDLDFDLFTLDDIEKVAVFAEETNIRENALCEKINQALRNANAIESQVDYF